MKNHRSLIARLATHALTACARRTYPASRFLLVVGLFQAGTVYSQNIWTGAAGTTNWSTPGNWSFGVAPTAGDTVLFDNVVVGSPAAVVDNIVDTGFTISGLTYQTVTTNGFHTTLIPAGLSLDINGSGTDAIFVGTGLLQGTGQNVYSRFVGPGTLTVTNTAGAIRVMQWGDNTDHRATLDLSGLTNLSADVRQILIATTSTTGEERMMASLLLAETNFIHTAAGASQPGVLVGSMDNGSTGKRGTQQIFLGRNNTIHSDAVSVGGFKMDGTVQVRSGITSGLTTLRGSAGGSDPVKILSIGDHRAAPGNYFRNGTSASVIGIFDTTGNFLDALVQDLYVARAQTNNTGLTTGTLTLNEGTLTADNLFVGYHQSPSAPNLAFNAIGTVNVNGTGTLTVNNDLVLARKVGTSVPTGTLNLSATGTVNVKGNLVNGGGTSTINLNSAGASINLQSSGDPTPGYVSISVLSGSGAIANASSVTNTTSIIPGTATTAGTLTVASNLTLASGATLNVNLANTATVGAGVNDLVSVQGDLNLNDNGVVITPIGNALATGSYRLFDYTGTLNGSLNFTNPTRYTVAASYPANGVDLTVSGGGPGTVRWAGTTSTAWDVATSNWFNTGSSATDRFLQYDNALVDDSGAYTNLLLLGTTLFPGAVTVNSSTINYLFGGSGRISGGASLTKQGTSTLTISNANDFTGPVSISEGVLRTINASALGTTNGGTTVASGATLDIFGSSLFNPGEHITIAGAGLSSTGAVINTGAGQNNAIRFLTLSDNATVRSDARWDVRGPGGASSFSGALNLNGFTLTKLGGAQMSVVDSFMTNSGSVEIGGGVFSMTRSQVDGPGSINVSSNALLFENFSTGYVAKAISANGGVIRNSGSTFTLFSPISNSGGVTLDGVSTWTITNVISGGGGVIKSNGGALTLEAVNTYTGPTTIVGGRLNLSTNASIANTPGITVGPGTTFDVSLVDGSFILASGQTLAGSGTVIGDVTAGSGTGIIPGTSAGTLNFSNNLSVSSSSNVFELSSDPTAVGGNTNDLILVNGALNLTGVNKVKIVPLAALNTSSPYTLFQYGTLSGGAANLDVQSDSRYAFSVVDPATTAPYIQVQVSGSGTAANLVWKGGALSNPNAWDTKVTSNWLNGLSFDVFYLGDSVQFDDTALTSSVSLAGTLQPASVVMSNSVLPYAFGGSGSLVAGSLANNGGTLTITNGNANTIAGALTLNGGTVTFANGGANTLVGGATLNAATLTLNNAGVNTLSGSVTIDGGTLTLNNTSGNTFSGGATLNTGTINVLNGAANAFGQPLSVNGGSVIFNQPIDVTFSGVITDNGSGAGAVVKQGGNALTLSGNNANYNGSIAVNAGMLRAGNANALGTITGGTTVASGATFDINGSSLYNPGDVITIAGTGLSSTGAVINAGAAQNNAVRALTLSANASIAAWGNRWDVRGPTAGAGALSLGGFTLTKLGTGRISVVDAVMTDPGSVEVVAGTLAFTRTSVDGAGFINMGPNLLLFENNSVAITFTKPLIFNAGTLQVTGNALGITSPITNLANLTIDAAAAFTAQGPITGPGGLTKIGTSSLILAETNDYTGGTLIGAGTVQLGLNGTLGNLPPQPSGVLTNNGTLIFNRSDDVTFNDQITGVGGVQQIAGGTVFLTASNSYSGQTLLNTTTVNSPAGAALRISHSDALGSAAGNTRIMGNTTGNGRLELVGNITVPEPFLVDARQAGTIDMPAVLNVSGNNTLTGTISGNTGGSDYNFQSDSGKLTVAGLFTPPNTAGTRRLKLMGDGIGEWSGVISNSTDTLVAALLAKAGLGTWTLSGSNVYRGSTTIRAGTLALGATGSINSTPTIDVQSGATFDVAAVSGGYALGADQTLIGNGTVVGNVTANGTVSPGTSIGTLTFANNLVLAGTSIMEIDRDASPTNADLILANALTYGGTLTVNNLGLPLQAGDTFNLFDAASFNGTFAQTQLPTLDPGLSWELSSLSANGTIKVASGVSTTPTNLTFQVTGNLLDISWPSYHTGWRLESQTNPITVGITTNWFTVPTSNTTNRMILDIDKATGTVFFRLAYP